jgi:photosystem II stability/assembly factor-like uncharacterized protein
MRFTHRITLAQVVGILSTSLTAFGQPPQGAGQQPTSPPMPPRFQYLGPPSAGRISAAAGIPGDTMTYYFGAASGGVWKTTDGARTFAPVFDDMPVQAIGALAVSRTNPRIVYAGSGEAWAIRDADVMGDGIYRSTDAGQTWKNVGLKETGRIGRVIIHPTNPDIVYACALGRATGPQRERGVFRTTDGGETWQHVLFVDERTGCSGLAIDPVNPKNLYAGTWEVVMHTWAMFSGGPGSGVYVSHDSGSTWTRATHAGLPKSPVGKIDVAVAPSNPKRVFALIQTADQGSVWRSDDGGEAWKVVSWDRRLIGRAGYYIRIEVNPQNENEVLVANSTFHRSQDGGETWPLSGAGCGDCHDIWMDPRNPSHWIVTGDGGAGFTRNHGQSYTQFTLPIGQMYHLAIDNRAQYWVYSNRQDDGTMRGRNDAPVPVPNVPSYRRPAGGGGGPFGGGGGGRPWDEFLGGCESGFTIPVPSDPDIVWATCYGNKVTRYDHKLGTARTVSPWLMTLDSEPVGLRYRCHWTPPLAIDPFDHNTVYYGCQVVFKTTNNGQSWTESPDLSTKDPSRIVSSGGVIGDNLGQFYGEVVFAIAPSELQRGLVWAGTNDGKIWYTPNGGVRWIDVTNNVAGMPVWGTVRRIVPSRFEAHTAYIAVDYHMMDNREPYIYKTADLGKTWSNVTGDLPKGHPLDYVLTVAENPNRKGMLFAGTGRAFYYSLDDGQHWKQYQAGLPAAPVTWIEVAKLNHDVAVSTYGRGLWLLTDITMLEQSDKMVADANVKIYEPRPGLRLARGGSIDFNLELKYAPTDSLRIEIADSAGKVVRTLRQAPRTGLNRVTWDLRYDGAKQPELRTIPPDNPKIWQEARFKGRDTRPIIHWGINGPQRQGPIAAPGGYAMRFSVNGTTHTQPFRVVADPALPSTAADLLANTAMQVRIRDAINETVEMINRLEVSRKQIEDQIKANANDAALLQQLRDIDKKLYDVEMLLLSRTEIHSDDKWYVEKYKLYLNLVWFLGEVGTGASDVAGGAEYRPTDTQVDLMRQFDAELAAAKAAFKKVVDVDLKAFNEAMAGRLRVVMDP